MMSNFTLPELTERLNLLERSNLYLDESDSSAPRLIVTAPDEDHRARLANLEAVVQWATDHDFSLDVMSDNGAIVITFYPQAERR